MDVNDGHEKADEYDDNAKETDDDHIDDHYEEKDDDEDDPQMRGNALWIWRREI